MATKVKATYTDELNAGFTVDKVEGVATATYNDKECFFKGTELSEETIKSVYDHTENYTKAASKAAKEEAQKIMEEDKKIDKVIVSMPFSPSARGELNAQFKREHTYPGIAGREDVTKSTMKIAITNPFAKISKNVIGEMEAEMTAALLK